jgi:hypothetical protein
MSLTSQLTLYLEIGAVALLVIVILGFINFYFGIPKRLKFLLNFVIIIGSAAWMLNDLGLLDTVINTVKSYINSI